MVVKGRSNLGNLWERRMGNRNRPLFTGQTSLAEPLPLICFHSSGFPLPLGQNDILHGGRLFPNKCAEGQATYKLLLQQVRRHRPGVPIICIYPVGIIHVTHPRYLMTNDKEREAIRNDIKTLAPYPLLPPLLLGACGRIGGHVPSHQIVPDVCVCGVGGRRAPRQSWGARLRTFLCAERTWTQRLTPTEIMEPALASSGWRDKRNGRAVLRSTCLRS